MKHLKVPYLGLLSIAIRQLKVPVAHFLTYLLDKKHGEMSFRRLITGGFLDQNINLKEINTVLDGYFSNRVYNAPESYSFQARLNAITANPLMGVQRALISKIQKLQFSLIFSGKLVLPEVVLSSVIYHEYEEALHAAASIAVRRSFEINSQEHVMAESLTGYNLLSERSQTIVRTFVHDMMLVPMWAHHYNRVSKFISHYQETGYLAKDDLQSLSVDNLLVVLESFISVESFFSAAEVEDVERRVGHKVNLRLLSTLKLPKDAKPTEEFSIGLAFTMFPMWEKVMKDPFLYHPLFGNKSGKPRK